MSIQIRSVPSTGTTFLTELLNAHGFDTSAKHWIERLKTETGLIIAPMRDPKDAWATWVAKKRGAPYAPTFEMFFNCWDQFNYNYEHNKDLVILDIDLWTRDLSLEIIGAYLGKELKTNWIPLNYTGRSWKALEPEQKIDLSPVYDLPLIQAYEYEAP